MKKDTSYQFISFVIIVLFITVLSCSTEKDAWVNRTYHNTTAHYNGYFNANEIIKEAMSEFELGRIEDYSKVIPVFIYANNEESKALYAPMDTAVSKCETVVARNSMPKEKVGQFKNAEWCKWIDDNWFVIGKAEFLKRDFEGALEKFTFIEKHYKGDPITHVAKLWRAKTLIELEQYDDAKEALEELLEVKELLKIQKEELEKAKLEAKEKAKKMAKRSSSKNRHKKKKKQEKEDKDKIAPLPKKFDRSLLPVFADLYLRQKEYKEAQEYLELSIDVVKKRKFKTRLMFILAQILQKSGGEGASSLYAQVVKRNPVYDMAFQAKINRALAYSGGDSKRIKAQLLKMLKDEKNEDYLDQIYYALGDIELREGNRPLGITYLEKSVVVSKANKVQKSKSFLRLGKLYYMEKNYTKAQQYYDSTMSVLPKEHPEYESIEEKNNSLSALVKNLEIIRQGDSISQLCSLSEKELLAKIDDIIEQKILDDEAEEERKRQEANQGVSVPSGKPTLGVFWAYDESLKATGYNEFKEVWGDRKLEDNWRRSDRSSLDFEEETEESLTKVDEKLTVDYYLKALPCEDDEKLAKIQKDVMIALYDAGDIYKTKLDDKAEAKASFISLTKRFLPENEAVAGLYQLYLMTSGEEQNNYKHKILNDFPNSEYAKIIQDPNYKQKEELAINEANTNYKLAFHAYQNKDYYKAILMSEKIIDSDKDNILLCKYYYLNAVAKAQKYAGSDSLGLIDEALGAVVKHCKGDEVYKPAKALLNKLRNVQSVSDAQSGKSTYVYSSDSKHFFVLVFPNDKGSINKAKAKVADFNTASFSTKNLKVESSFVDQNTQVIVTKSFKNKEEAMDYYVAFKVNKKQVKHFTKGFDFFVITDKNFASLYVDKDVQKYVQFFEKNYVD